MPKKKIDTEERKLISARVKKPLIKALKQIALDRDTELYLIVEEAIEQYVTINTTK